MKQAKGFGLNEIDESNAFKLGEDRESDPQVARARIEQLTGEGDEETIRLDIDNVDLVKLQASKPETKKKTKKSAKYLSYKKLHKVFKFKRGIAVREKQNFYELLGVMIEAGISINQALSIYLNQTNDKYFRQVCQSLTWQIEKGQSFSQSLGDFPQIFSESERGIIMAAEVSGRLVESLKRLAIDVEKQADLRRKIVGALLYPAIVMIFVIGTVFVLLNYVIPEINALFENVNSELPWITKLVINASDFVVANTVLIISGFLLLIGLCIFLYSLKPVKFFCHYIALKLPVIGEFQSNLAQAGFASSIANLVASGVRIVQAIQITANSLKNMVYRKQVRLLAKDVENGIQIGDSLKNSPYFSDMLVSMISVGERTAQLDNIAAKLDKYYTERVSYMADNLTKLLQPFVIAVVGSIVGLIVLAIMLPMSELINSIGA